MSSNARHEPPKRSRNGTPFVHKRDLPPISGSEDSSEKTEGCKLEASQRSSPSPPREEEASGSKEVEKAFDGGRQDSETSGPTGSSQEDEEEEWCIEDIPIWQHWDEQTGKVRILDPCHEKPKVQGLATDNAGKPILPGIQPLFYKLDLKPRYAFLLEEREDALYEMQARAKLLYTIAKKVLLSKSKIECAPEKPAKKVKK